MQEVHPIYSRRQLSFMQMIIFCPLCLSENKKETIRIMPTDRGAVCSQCQRRYTILTRRLQRVESEKITDSAYRYRFYSREGDGGERVRTAIASPHSGIRPGHQVTFVWRGRSLVGLADQENNTWHSLNIEPPLYPRLHAFLRFIRWPILLLLLLQGARLLVEWPTVASNHPLPLIIVVVATLSLLAAPLALWAFRTGGPESKYLPDYDGSWQEGDK